MPKNLILRALPSSAVGLSLGGYLAFLLLLALQQLAPHSASLHGIAGRVTAGTLLVALAAFCLSSIAIAIRQLWHHVEASDSLLGIALSVPLLLLLIMGIQRALL